MMTATRAEPGSILFPDESEGWSPLVVAIVERACDYALGTLPFPVRRWGGAVPDLGREDLLLATSELMAERPDLPTRDFLEAFASAMEWIGLE